MRDKSKNKRKKKNRAFKFEKSISSNDNNYSSTITVTRRTNPIKKFFKSTYGIISVIATILGLTGFFTLKDEFEKWFLTDKQKYEKQYFIPGILIPNDLSSKDSLFYIDFGGIDFKYNIEDFKKGVEVTVSTFSCGTNTTQPGLSVRIKNNRLFISTIIKDIEKEEVVGIMNYNYWSLFIPNMLTYKADANGKSLEVYDRQGFTVFSITLFDHNHLKVKGYFISNDIVMVVGDKGLTNCINKSNPIYKTIALSSIRSSLINRQMLRQ